MQQPRAMAELSIIDRIEITLLHKKKNINLFFLARFSFSAALRFAFSSISASPTA
jgi:hypothetical protein